MRRHLEIGSCLALLLAASVLGSCKKKTESAAASASAEPSAAVAPSAAPSAAPSSNPAELMLGNVKRFMDREEKFEGVATLLEDDVKVYNEPDTSQPQIASLKKDALVNQQSKLDDWALVEFLSGAGELSPGWVQAKALSTDVQKLSEEEARAKVIGQPQPQVAEVAEPTAKVETAVSKAPVAVSTGAPAVVDKKSPPPTPSASSKAASTATASASAQTPPPPDPRAAAAEAADAKKKKKEKEKEKKKKKGG